MYLLRSAPEFNGLVLFILAVLVFVPIRYVYPSKTRPLRPLTLLLGGLWGLTLAALLLTLEHPARWLLAISFLYPVYYFVLSFTLHFRMKRASGGPL
jgi:phosphatidylcholine synthase